MGFPVDYTDVFVPKIFIHVLFLLGYVRSTLHSLFHFLGFTNLHEQPAESTLVYYIHEPATRLPASTQLFNVLIKEYLPAVIYSKEEEDGRSEAAREMCVVCLYGFEDGEEIRWLKNCKHLFHRRCIDRWMDYNQRNCPLCRTGMMPRQKEDEFNQRMWAESDDIGGGDFEGDDDHREGYGYLL